jgi:ribose 5-phosphate isomerase A
MSKRADMGFDITAASKDLMERFGIPAIMGLGSGSTVAQFVKILADEARRRNVKPICIPSSIQIQEVIHKFRLDIGHPSQIPKIQLVVDGADQVDHQLVMLKGGGGALLREKVLHRATKKLVIIIGHNKLRRRLNAPVPVEVLPFAQSLVDAELRRLGGIPRLRVFDKGYPLITDNGNIILDTEFGELTNPADTEQKVKCIPGVVEVGIFTRRPDAVYVIGKDGSYEILDRPSEGQG